MSVEITGSTTDLPRSLDERAVCCFVDRSDRDAIREGLDRLGFTGGDQEQMRSDPVHPEVRDLDGRILVTLFALGADAELISWVFVVVGRVLLIIGDHDGREAVLSEVKLADEPRTAMGGAILGLARSITSRLAELAEDAQEFRVPSRGFSRADERSTIRVRRGQLFAMQEIFAFQAQLLDDDEELAVLLGHDSDAAIRRARSVFDFNRGTSSRLYALAGDVLSEQSALVNERLTLVSTFFLPLTVSTGFFGMNFGWMTGRVGSLAAFLVLGLVVPALTTAVTLFVVRRLGASGS